MSIRHVLVSGSAALVLGLSVSAGAATIAQYNFDSLTGQNVPDISGNGHDVTFNNNQVSASSDNPFGQAGNNSVVVTYNAGTVANKSTVDLNNGGQNKVTFEGWINPSGYGATDNQVIVYMLGVDAGNTFVAFLGMDTAGKASTRIYNGGPTPSWTSSADQLVLNSWNYLAAVYDGNWLHLYLKNDNHPTLTEVGSVELGVSLPTTITGYVNVASESNNVPTKFDDIRISNSALSDAQLGYHASFTPVPEPAALSLLGLGGLLLARRKRV